MLARLNTRRNLAIVAIAALGAILAGSLVAARSSPAPNLPAIGAKRLVASVLGASARHTPVSGTATIGLDLGLPEVPSTEAGPGTGPLALLSGFSGSHTLRVWVSSDGVRVAELLPAEERAVFATKRSLWLWDSTGLTAYRVRSRGGTTRPSAPATTTPAGLTPMALASNALHAIRPTTRVWVGTPTTVAGRPVYPLMLEPRTRATLVGRIEIDVDSQTRTPLRVSVTPRGAAAPALSSGFTSVSFDPIDPSIFRFSPPPGSTVETITMPASGSHDRQMAGTTSPAVRTFGRGWAEIVAIRVPSRLLEGNGTLREVSKLLPYSGPLVSVRLETVGTGEWLLAGMVAQSSLVDAASRLP